MGLSVDAFHARHGVVLANARLGAMARRADGAGADLRHMPSSAALAIIFFSVLDLIAGVGLWLATPWGGVLWLLIASAQIFVAASMPQFFAGGYWLIGVDLVLIVLYFGLTFEAGRDFEAQKLMEQFRRRKSAAALRVWRKTIGSGAAGTSFLSARKTTRRRRSGTRARNPPGSAAHPTAIPRASPPAKLARRQSARPKRRRGPNPKVNRRLA